MSADDGMGAALRVFWAELAVAHGASTERAAEIAEKVMDEAEAEAPSTASAVAIVARIYELVEA